MNCLCEFFERCDCLDDWYCDLESNINVGSKMKSFLLKNEVEKCLFCAPKIQFKIFCNKKIWRIFYFQINWKTLKWVMRHKIYLFNTGIQCRYSQLWEKFVKIQYMNQIFKIRNIKNILYFWYLYHISNVLICWKC